MSVPSDLIECERSSLKRVLLVDMPFGGVDRPAIGISTIKAELCSRGVACDIQYLNFRFAALVGPALYQWFSDRMSHMIFAGEWLFASHFFDGHIPAADHYFSYLRRELNIPEEHIRLITRMRELIPGFMEDCLKSIEWERYSIIGFSSTFEQNAASLALAYAIKSRHPEIAIVLGGANCEGSMGAALHRHFPFVDYVFTGPSDLSFPDFVERYGEATSFEDIPGLVFRRGEESVSTGPARGPRHLDELPVPDYQDYFEQLRSTTIANELAIRLQIETSRGCWWGMKHHCTFCGMYAEQMHFNSKSPKRVLAELEELVAKHGIRGIDAVDAIMDMSYFKALLPVLKARGLGLELFYELKANLSRQQVQLLAEAGIKFIQPGIESFHPRILKLMRKGTSPLQNVQLLKWCKQFGIEPTWNLLYGFPGEQASDYTEMVQFASKLLHLPPPRGCGKLRMDRFSPHFDNPEEFGFANVRPLKAYHYIYPLLDDEIAEIAYFFDYDYKDGRDPDRYAAPLVALVREWQERPKSGRDLTMSRSADRLVVRDSRQGVEDVIMLQGWEAIAYCCCDRALSLQAVADAVNEKEHDVSAEQVSRFLEDQTNRGLMLRDGTCYLSLAVDVSPVAADDTLSDDQLAAA